MYPLVSTVFCFICSFVTYQSYSLYFFKQGVALRHITLCGDLNIYFEIQYNVLNISIKLYYSKPNQFIICFIIYCKIYTPLNFGYRNKFD